MDPITAAILLAVGRLGERVINDGYDALKAAIRRKWGPKSDLMRAVEDVEKKPESPGRQNTLSEEVSAAKAHLDSELLKIAQALLDKLPERSNISIANTQHAGDGNIQVGQIIGRDVNIVQGAPKPDAAALLRSAVGMLSFGAYEQAIAALTEAINAEPSVSDSHYYIALALLRGRRPKVLSYSEAEAISQHLKTACRLGGRQAHFFYLWALVKFDFYLTNGFQDRAPYIADLLNWAEDYQPNQTAIREMLEHTGAEDSQVTAHIRRRLRA